MVVNLVEIGSDLTIEWLKKETCTTFRMKCVAHDYFVARKSGEAIGLLLRWIKTGRAIAAKELADLVISQLTANTLDLELCVGRMPPKEAIGIR